MSIKESTKDVNNKKVGGLEKLKKDIKAHYKKMEQYKAIASEAVPNVRNFSNDGVELPSSKEVESRKLTSKYQQAAANQSIVNGRVERVYDLNGNWCVIVRDKGISTYIPYDTFILPSAIKERSTARDHKPQLERYLGFDVSFKLNYFDPNSKVAIGNRIEAMDEIKRNFFFGKDEENEFLINRGSTLRAKIIHVQNQGIQVEILGEELFVQKSYLNEFQSKGDFSPFNFYHPGEYVNLIVTEIERDFTTHTLPLIHVVGDEMLYNYETAEKIDIPIQEIVSVGERRIGRVTSANEQYVYISVESELKPFAVRAEYNRRNSYTNTMPKVGDELIVRIEHIIPKEDHKDKENPKDLIFGVIASKL